MSPFFCYLVYLNISICYIVDRIKLLERVLKMDLQGKLQFLMANVGELNESDKTVITQLYRRVQKVTEAKAAVDALQLPLFARSDLMHKRFSLKLMSMELSSYLYQKGLRHSSMQMDELLSLIQSDITTVDGNISDMDGAIDSIKALIQSTNT